MVEGNALAVGDGDHPRIEHPLNDEVRGQVSRIALDQLDGLVIDCAKEAPEPMTTFGRGEVAERWRCNFCHESLDLGAQLLISPHPLVAPLVHLIEPCVVVVGVEDLLPQACEAPDGNRPFTDLMRVGARWRRVGHVGSWKIPRRRRSTKKAAATSVPPWPARPEPLQLGDALLRLHREQGALAHARLFDNVIRVGEDILIMFIQRRRGPHPES